MVEKKTKSTLTDLNTHLFAQMERLSEEDLEGEKLSAEIERSRAVTSVAKEIISNARLVLDAQTAVNEGMAYKMPRMLGTEMVEE